MDFELTQDQQIFYDSVKRFAVNELADGAVDRANSDGYLWDIAARFAEMGLLGITIPESKGGIGGSLTDAVLAIQAIAEVCPRSADVVQAGNFGAIRTFAEYANADQLARILPDLLAGKGVMSVGMSEPDAGSSVTELKTSATPDGDDFLVNGSKVFGTNSGDAEVFLIYLRFGPGTEGIGSALIEKGTAGFEIGPGYRYMNGESWSPLYFDNCRIPKANILLGSGGFKKQISGFNIERLGNAARAVAVGRKAFSEARDHAKTRRQFGRDICEFQGLQWKFAEMQMRLEAAQLLLMRAVTRADNDLPSAQDSALAKLACNDAGFYAANEALQIMGALGFSDDNIVQYCMRRTRGWMIAGGSTEILKNRIAEGIFERRFFTTPAQTRKRWRMIMTDFAQPLIAPQSVALIGVSGDAKKLSARPLQFCQQHGFAGNIYIVNPRHDEVLGQKAYRSVTAIPDKVDHAYILIGTDLVEAALDDCIAAGVRVVSILADGFAEAGDAGMARQARLVAKAKTANMVLIGPNSMGVVNTNNGFVCTTNAAFKTDELPRGRLAVLSHSGSLIGTLISRGQERNIGFAALISLGNEAQSCVGSIGLELVEDDHIDGFVLFLETMRNPEIFATFAAAANRLGKPVVTYMLGKSSDGQALSVSHTGAMTGEAKAVRAFLAHHNIAEVSQFDALFEAPALLLKKPQLKSRPRRATVVTTTGGGGAMLVDQLSIRGVDLAGLSPASTIFFKDQQIPCGSGKLVDVTLAGAQYDIMKKTITQLINDPETGIVVVAIGSSAQFNPELAVKPIIDAVEENPAAAPVIAFPLPIAKQSMAMLEANGIPCFGSVESCADSVALLLAAQSSTLDDHLDDAIDLKNVQQQLDAVIKAAAIGGDGGVLNEVDGNQIFTSLGLKGPRQLFLPLPEIKPQPASASVAKAGLAYPLVAKLVSPDLPHKSDYGAVVLSIETGDALDAAVAQMRQDVISHLPAANIEGLLLQEMAFGLGEALVGLRHDNLVGPIITVGAGGIFAEIYKDVSIRPAPVNLATARKMIDEVKGFAALRGYRGTAKGDLEALADLVANLSQLANLRRIAEAEINPVLVQADGVLMLDALIRIQLQPMLDSAAS